MAWWAITHPVLRYVGLRSYALYLWHKLTEEWLEVLPALEQVALATLLSFLFAELSYRLIERPALRLKDRFAVVRVTFLAARVSG